MKAPFNRFFYYLCGRFYFAEKMDAKKILFIAQEISPYLPESEIANICRHLPQGIQEQGCEIRTFMPKYGCINERRNQLHEVIRLSGMNLIIDDTDHPLIIKVASIQSARTKRETDLRITTNAPSFMCAGSLKRSKNFGGFPTSFTATAGSRP